MRLLASAFEPFGGRRRNTSADLLRKLKLRSIFPDGDVDCRKVFLPVNFDTAWPRLRNIIDQWKPDLLVLTGEGKAAPVTLETAARNQRRSEPQNSPINPELPPLIHSVAGERLGRELNSKMGISVEQDPGDYLCNFIYFQCLSNRPKTPAVFLHINPLPDDAKPTRLTPIKLATEQVFLLAAKLLIDRPHKSN